MDKTQTTLLDNHLAFLETHRGTVRRAGALLFVESDRPEFTYAILGEGPRLRDLPTDVRTLQLLPASGVTAAELGAAGFTPSIGLSYMVLRAEHPDWRVRKDLVVTRVRDAAEMDVFSEVQSRGFNETEESYGRWHPWLRAANHRNLGNPDQVFYVGRLGTRAVGTVLTVFSGTTAGIYAVATLADQRRQGISTTVLQQAVLDATAKGVETITLQVKQDSYVEEFYRGLGFERLFTTAFFNRPT
jgi:ribosomal protein S18 acetylase RimI-like enzyme